MGIKAIIAKLPSKEQGFFGVTLLIGAGLLLMTPMSQPKYESLRSGAIEAGKSTFDSSKVEALLDEAKKPPAQANPAEAEKLREKFKDALTVAQLPKEARDLFKRSSDVSMPLPPETFAFPPPPDLPGFASVVGDAPDIRYQERAAPPAPSTPVRLTPDTSGDSTFENRPSR